MPYTKEETAVLENTAAPITYEVAGEIAEQLGKSHRSVISKIKSLDIPYVPKVVERKRPAGRTKAEVVADLEAALNTDTGWLAGLENARGMALARLFEAMSDEPTAE